MHRTLFSFLFLFVCSFTLVGAAFPTYTGWVNDGAVVLTSEDRVLLDELFTFVEQNTTAEVVFVSVVSTEGADRFTYAHGLASAWGVGKADRDNGMVMVYDAETNKLYVVVGDGIEGILPDSKLGRYLDTYYVPARDAGNVSQGIVAFSQAIAREMMLNAEEIRSGQTGDNTVDTFGEVIVLLVILGLGIWFWWYVVHGPGKKRFGVFPVFFGGGSGGHSSFGSGGGFSGFGGGHFSGGGAGR